MTGLKQKESTLNKNFVKWLNKIPGCLAMKRYGGPGQRGKPDVTGCILLDRNIGVRIEMEGKVGDNKPTPIQKTWLRKWKQVGAITGVFWSLDEAKEIFIKEARDKGIEI